jgi:GNAT superfamily N-acetyltransferase
MDMDTLRELSAEETALAYLAMLELRPGIGTTEHFVEHINRIQRAEGYRLVGAFVPGELGAAAVAGFRTTHMLAWGYAIYCDDLSTRAAYRGRGLAGKLMDWMIAEARKLGCSQLHLDSGVGADRQDAHRLYLKKRMRISAHHFSFNVA